MLEIKKLSELVQKKSTNLVKIKGLTLMELVVTLCIVAIMAGVSIKKMSALKGTKNIVDDVTEIIMNQLNQANARSNFSYGDNIFQVCNIIPGAGADIRARCNNTSNTWQNVNGISINPKVTVSISSYSKNTGIGSTRIVTYKNGSIDPSLNLGDSANPAFSITINGTTGDPSCTNNGIPNNLIKIWQNGVIDVEKTC